MVIGDYWWFWMVFGGFLVILGGHWHLSVDLGVLGGSWLFLGFLGGS